MVSKTKLYKKLDELEAQLRESLIPHLMRAVAGDNDLIFCVKAFNPYRELNNKTDKLSEELIDIGSHILSLRDKLDEPSGGIIAERICWYCREWGNNDTYQRSSAAILAKQFLLEIEHN